MNTFIRAITLFTQFNKTGDLGGKMKNLLLFVLLLSFAFLIAGTPHEAIWQVDQGGSPPDTLQFTAYISSRPEQILTEGSAGCYYNVNLGTITIQCGSFPVQWQEGDLLIVNNDVAQEPMDWFGQVSGELTLSPVDMFDGWYLEPEPIPSPDAPINVMIMVEYSMYNLTWEAVSEAYSYSVYGSDEPDDFFFLIASDVTNTSWMEYATDDIKFFYITSVAAKSESEPSETVGYKRYILSPSSSTNLNLISLPFETEYVNASDLASSIPNCDAISKWDNLTQSWFTANNAGYKWLNDFTLTDGYSYMVNVLENNEFYIAGKLITQPIYDLQAGKNLIMLPLDRSDLDTASLLGDEIYECDTVSDWDDAGQEWSSATKNVFGSWINDFSISIGTPLMVNVTDSSDWPNRNKSEEEK